MCQHAGCRTKEVPVFLSVSILGARLILNGRLTITPLYPHTQTCTTSAVLVLNVCLHIFPLPDEFFPYFYLSYVSWPAHAAAHDSVPGTRIEILLPFGLLPQPPLGCCLPTLDHLPYSVLCEAGTLLCEAWHTVSTAQRAEAQVESFKGH